MLLAVPAGAVMLGIFLHAVGGFAAASFYIPINKVKHWAWENYWIMQGVAAWLIAPWLLSLLTVPDGALPGIVKTALSDYGTSAFWATFFGMLWGLGALTFGLSMRYLGVSLGQSVALGFTTAFGTMIPPIYSGEISEMFSTTSGLIAIIGVAVCIAGIATVGYAGSLKEKSMTDEEKRFAVKEFALKKGILIAIFSGIMSSCFAFAINAGEPIRDMALAAGTPRLFSNNPVYIFIMAGGFFTNFIWTIILNIRNRTFRNYTEVGGKVLLNNLLFSFLGGFTWYFQFFFYGMGERMLGDKYSFASWSIHMAFIIVFSNMWGLILKEWRSATRATMTSLIFGIVILILSTFIIGISTSINH